MSDNQLIIRIVADLKDIKRKLPELEKGLKKTADTGKRGFKAMDGAIGSFTKRLGGTLVSIYALKKVWDFTGNAAMKQEAIFRKLQTSVEITGIKYSDVKEEIDKTFASLQALTQYGDTDSAQALTTLLQLTSDYEKSMQGLPMVLDLAATGLFDVNTAARYVAMAFEGNVEMLGRYIPELKASNNEIIKTGTAAEKTAEFMRIFNEKFTGTAQKNLDSSTTKIQRLKNYLSDMGEAAGDKAAKGIGDLAGNFTEFLMILGETQLETTVRQLKEMGVEAEKLVGLQYLVDTEKAFKAIETGSKDVEKTLQNQASLLGIDIVESIGVAAHEYKKWIGDQVNGWEATQVAIDNIDYSNLTSAKVKTVMSGLVKEATGLGLKYNELTLQEMAQYKTLKNQINALQGILKSLSEYEESVAFLTGLQEKQAEALSGQTDEIDQQIAKTTAIIALKKEVAAIKIPEIDATKWSYTYDQLINDNRELVNALGYVGDTMSDVMVNGVDMMEAMEQTFKMLIVQAIKYAVIWSAISAFFPGSSALAGGGFGEFLIKGLFGSGFAGGTSDAPGGWSMVGEQGPEMMFVPQHSQVYTSSQTRTITQNLMNTSALERKLDQVINAIQTTPPRLINSRLRGADIELSLERTKQNKMSD